MDGVWSTGGDWVKGVTQTDTGMAVFDASSVANLNTKIVSDASDQGVKVTTLPGLITIGGVNALTFGVGGMSMSGALQDLQLAALVALATEQSQDAISGQALATNGVIHGAKVNLSRIDYDDFTLKGANSFAGKTAVEDRPLSVSGNMIGVKAEKLAFTNLGTTQIGVAPSVGPRAGELRIGSGAERGGVRSASNGGKSTVKITVREGVKAGSNTKPVILDTTSEDLRAALELPHGAGPSLAQFGDEGLTFWDTGSINTDASKVTLDDANIVPVIHQFVGSQYVTVKLVPLVSPPVPQGTYGINFHGAYRAPNADVTGILGPGPANQANWVNTSSNVDVNDGPGNWFWTATDSNLGNPISFHFVHGNAGGEDGGGGGATDFARLYNTGERSNDGQFTITSTTVIPFSLYDIYIYGGGGYNVNGNSTTTSFTNIDGFTSNGNTRLYLDKTGPLTITGGSINGFSIVPVTPPTVAYWKGTTSGVWNANVNNFTQDSAGTNPIRVPVSGVTDVIFNASGATNFANTTLGVDTTIKSLTFGSNATSAVGIGGGNTLTITPTASTSGVTVASLSGNHALSTNVALGAAQTWTVTDASQILTASGVISGAFSLTKAGAGTLVLTADNTYSGGTTAARGTLALDYTVVGSKLADAGILTFAGGTVEMRNGAGSHNEAVASTTIADGLSGVTRTSGTSVLRLNAITPGLGVLNFGAASIADTDRTNNNGILGAWATVTGNDWAINFTNVADGPVTAYASYTDINVRNDIITNAATTNVRLFGDGSAGNIALGAATTTVNTLLQNNANFAGTVDTAGKTLAANGIMIGSGRQALTVGVAAGDGTTMAATAGGTLFLNNFSTANAITINAVIANNASASNLATVGLVALNGTNTYTGMTMVNSGVLSVRNGAGLGSGFAGVSSGTTVHLGAALELQHGTGMTIGTEVLTLNGTGISSGGALRNISGANTWGATVTLASSSRINSDAGTLTLSASNSITASNQNLTLGGLSNGLVSGTITTGTGTLTKDGTGMWTLSGANTYTGATQVNAGTLLFKNTAARSGGSAVTAGASGTIGLGVGGAGFYSANDVSNLFNNTLSGFTMDPVSGVAIDTTAGDFDQTNALTTATRALTKLGANTLTLSAINTYTGPTAVNEGSLLLSGSVTSNTTVNAASLTVSGTLTGTVTANNGSTILLIGTIAGATTVNSASTLIAKGTLSGSTVVNSGGTLGGTGTTGSVTVNGGVIAPGDPSAPSAIGDLTVNGNVSFSGTSALNIQFDYDIPAKDLLNLTGTGILTISSGAVLNLSVSVSDAVAVATPYIGTPLTIIDYADGGWTSTGPGNNVFVGMNDDQTFIAPSGFTYRISYDGTGGVSEVTLTLMAIPEPGVAMSLLGGLGLLLGVRRRRV